MILNEVLEKQSLHALDDIVLSDESLQEGLVKAQILCSPEGQATASKLSFRRRSREVDYGHQKLAGLLVLAEFLVRIHWTFVCRQHP
jgi:hypothetical protein